MGDFEKEGNEDKDPAWIVVLVILGSIAGFTLGFLFFILMGACVVLKGGTRS
jgi:hypothetical protein